MIPLLPPSYTSNWTGPDKPGFLFFILVSVNGGLSLYQYVQDKHHHHQHQQHQQQQQQHSMKRLKYEY